MTDYGRTAPWEVGVSDLVDRSCDELREAPDFPGCCGSCHDDREDGFDDVYFENGTGTVCCRVKCWLGKKGRR